MNNYEFTVEVDGLDVNSPDQMGKLAETPEGIYILPAIIGRSQQLSCEVSADELSNALRDVYQFVVKACPEIKLRSIVPDVVNTTEIAELLGLSRETVRKWDSNEYRNFPRPYTSVGAGTRVQAVWIWGDVFAWAQSEGYTAQLDESATPLTRAQIREADFEIQECFRKEGVQETHECASRRFRKSYSELTA
ncbi:helix-turn-helix transcriptional regulator [Trueperella bialowiezensis]|uniref:Helix-turn-helix domain n=1 Tax=Trueperella bialowiezensis TaxID=312285 RepID=A0A448PDX3_9ACTO|nr:hypothetical protein [Trueperella bialowiezensis]VEI13120.1 Uncharacterised protein [Trueperella bialowiezensis]